MEPNYNLFLTEKCLKEWGHWCHIIATMGLDYNSKSLLTRIQEGGGMIIQGTATILAPDNERAEEVNVLIELLAKEQKAGGVGKPEWANVIRIHYAMFQDDYKTKLKMSGLSRQTYYRYLKAAQDWLSRAMD